MVIVIGLTLQFLGSYPYSTLLSFTFAHYFHINKYDGNSDVFFYSNDFDLYKKKKENITSGVFSIILSKECFLANRHVWLNKHFMQKM